MSIFEITCNGVDPRFQKVARGGRDIRVVRLANSAKNMAEIFGDGSELVGI